MLHIMHKEDRLYTRMKNLLTFQHTVSQEDLLYSLFLSLS